MQAEPPDGWANKCLQKALVRLCDVKQRRSALAYFRSRCANDFEGVLGDCAVERGNFLAVLAFLDVSQLFVWVYDSEGCAVGEAWRLGTRGAVRQDITPAPATRAVRRGAADRKGRAASRASVMRPP